MGWRVKPTGKGTAFYAPADQVRPGCKGIVTTHGTPSDHRAFKNFLSDLRNEGGLIWPPARAEVSRGGQTTDVDTPTTPPIENHLVGQHGLDPSGLSHEEMTDFHDLDHEDRDDIGHSH